MSDNIADNLNQFSFVTINAWLRDATSAATPAMVDACMAALPILTDIQRERLAGNDTLAPFYVEGAAQ